MQPASIHLIMYGRSSCHLCDDMRDALEDLQGELRYTLEFRDIDSNKDWRDKYGLKIPVLVSGDTEICHFQLDPVALRAHFSTPA